MADGSCCIPARDEISVFLCVCVCVCVCMCVCAWKNVCEMFDPDF